jgi:hypothetical protein
MSARTDELFVEFMRGRWTAYDAAGKPISSGRLE